MKIAIVWGSVKHGRTLYSESSDTAHPTFIEDIKDEEAQRLIKLGVAVAIGDYVEPKKENGDEAKEIKKLKGVIVTLESAAKEYVRANDNLAEKLKGFEEAAGKVAGLEDQNKILTEQLAALKTDDTQDNDGKKSNQDILSGFTIPTKDEAEAFLAELSDEEVAELTSDKVWLKELLEGRKNG